MEFRDQKFRTNGVLSVIQFVTGNADLLDYLSFQNALSLKLIEVSEVSESGSVNNLKVVNNADKFVFISDGDLLVGAKQNRVLNTSVFLKPSSVTVIPVSCVEAGR